MSNDQQAQRKVMMPEILPRPVSVPGSPARARVLAHLRLLAATGAATMTLAACPFLAVDPLPPPPTCRTTRGVASDLVADVISSGTLSSDAGVADGGVADAGAPDAGAADAGANDGGTAGRIFTLQMQEAGFSEAVSLTSALQVTNTRRFEFRQTRRGDRLIYELVFEPLEPARTVEARFSTSCEGTAAVVLVASLTPGAGGYSVVLFDAP